MLSRCVLLAVVMLALQQGLGAAASLAFWPAGKGLFEFDTGVLKGRLKLDVFSPYRVFETNKRYGNAARDWPTVTRLLADGAVEARWAPAAGHPVEMTAVYRWTAADTLDLATTVKPQRAMPHFELFVSSYFTSAFRASVYLRPKGKPEGQARFAPVDRKAGSRGGYVMFPRDPAAVAMIRDGRWKIPPSAVDWALERWLAAPLAMRRDKAGGLTAVMMSPPKDCFAVSSPWNPASPKAGGYRSLYLSLFGRDLAAGETAQARCRLVIARRLSDGQALQRYRAYLKE